MMRFATSPADLGLVPPNRRDARMAAVHHPRAGREGTPAAWARLHSCYAVNRIATSLRSCCGRRASDNRRRCEMTDVPTSASCRCGKVELQLTGAPILRGICYCASCQEAGRRHQAAPGADPVLAEDGGTDYVLYRKDRVRCVQGRRLVGGAAAETGFADAAPVRALLQHGHVPRLHQGPLALALSRPPSRRHPASRHADDDRRTARGRDLAERHAPTIRATPENSC